MSTLTKQTIIDSLRRFARQRPGLEYGNYGDPVAYRAELRSITKDLSEAQRMLRAIELRDSITAEDLLQAARGAFSGRLSIDPATGAIDYCTGQYWPTEYRRAVCAVCASALWSYWRDSASATEGTPTHQPGIVNMGDYLRRTASREFGRGIASRWFR